MAKKNYHLISQLFKDLHMLIYTGTRSRVVFPCEIKIPTLNWRGKLAVTPNETVMSVKACSRCSRGLHKLLFQLMSGKHDSAVHTARKICRRLSSG